MHTKRKYQAYLNQINNIVYVSQSDSKETLEYINTKRSNGEKWTVSIKYTNQKKKYQQ